MPGIISHKSNPIYLFAFSSIILLNIILAVKYRHIGGDLDQDYLAAWALRNAQSIYGESIPRLAAIYGYNTNIGNFHPPFNSILFLPLTLLPLNLAFVAMAVISLTLYLYCLELFLNYSNIPTRISRTLLIIAPLWYPILFAVGTGNTSVIIASLILLSWLALVKGSKRKAGILLGTSVLIKLFPAFIFLYLLFKKEHKVLIYALSTTAFGFLISLIIVGPADCIYYVTDVISHDVKDWGYFPLNASLTGLFYPLFIKGPWTSPLLEIPLAGSFFTLIFSGIVIGVVCLKSARSDESKKELLFSLYLVSMILLSPISWMHIFVVLMLPYTLFLKMAISKQFTLSKIVLIAISFTLISIPDVYLTRHLMTLASPNQMPWTLFLVAKLPTYGLLLLWGTLVAALPREPR